MSKPYQHISPNEGLKLALFLFFNNIFCDSQSLLKKVGDLGAISGYPFVLPAYAQKTSPWPGTTSIRGAAT